jgi:hypothetical protein
MSGKYPMATFFQEKRMQWPRPTAGQTDSLESHPSISCAYIWQLPLPAACAFSPSGTQACSDVQVSSSPFLLLFERWISIAQISITQRKGTSGEIAMIASGSTCP